MSDPASSNPTNSAANSTAETVVNPLGSRTAPPPPPPGQNSTGPPQQPNAANAEDWPARAREALSLADDLVLPWRGKRMRPAMLNTVHSRAENILQTIRAAYPHCEPVLQVRLGVYRTDLAQLCVDIEQFNIESSTSSGSDGESRERNTGGGPSAHSSPRGHQPPPPPQQSPTTLAFNERTVRYLLDLISDRNLPDVALGSDVDNETLKELHDVKVKEITSLIKDCREATRKYATCVGAIPGLIDRAQTQCERAYEWTRQVLERFRGNQLHLSGNMLAKDVTFKQFDPNGPISVYEFLGQFEEWAKGYISDECKAHLLFTKYLPKSLTEAYDELKQCKLSYHRIKTWLIDNFGMVSAVANTHLKAIRALKVPKSSDDSITQSRYLRLIHRHLITLFDLEVRQGVRVPGLREYISGNMFLMQVGEILPGKIQKEWTLSLAEKNLIMQRVEGIIYYNKILELLKKNYQALEFQSQLPSTDSASKLKTTDTPAKPKTKTHVTVTAKSSADEDSDDSDPPAPRTKKKTKKKSMAASAPPKSPDGKQTPKNQPAFSRWTCLIKGHEGHSLAKCKEFFEASPKKRRELCNRQGCWTCLSRLPGCKADQCSRLKDIPTLLLCQDCTVKSSRPSRHLNILMCGIAEHTKPDEKAIGKALEKWIPKFEVSKLSAPISTTFATAHSSKCRNPPKSKSSQPNRNPPRISYDTSTGNVKHLTPQDEIVKPSKEEAFYIMQQLCIKGEDVLAFFDSGSNAHLVEGDLAERVGFPVLDDRCIQIGVVGGGEIWSDYGQYLCHLGPDVRGRHHEIECQGLSRISGAFPEFDLQPVATEASPVIHQGWAFKYPKWVGGDRVKLLLGIKATSLAPVLHYTLPGGLGVYQSALVDVHGSTICYGGPHEVFTRGYARAGMSANHLQVLFTEAATAYMRSPYSFVCSKTSDHGPPPPTPRAMLTADVYPESFEDWCEQRELSAPLSLPSPKCFCRDIRHAESPNHCFKAAIPLSKLKGLMDEDDIPAVIDSRCEACLNCPTCRLSARAKTRSLQESYEQDVIEKSVTIDLEEKKVLVDLPFIKPPVDFLTKRHQREDNLYQATRIYRSQCKKSEEVKEEIRAAHKDLVGKGFMVPLASLSPAKKKLISTAPFRHYFPWRAVYKPGSVSTPVRLVVDPSCTGLNLILAKGQNMLPLIPEILVQLRTHRAAWSTDIRKLYNMLHLNDSALPYSLFLFENSLSEETKPETWVMQRAWYGVASTGNQAGVALERLAEINQDTFPLATAPLLRHKYVDDVVSGANSKKEREDQIQQTAECLATAGFSMKFVARSGEPPPSDASTDGLTVGCLGLSWNTEADKLAPALQSMNLKKKIRGQKAAPDRDLSHADGLRAALQDGLITRAGVLSRVAEFFDPAGWWEPLRLQMKLSLQDLNPLDWSDTVPDEYHETWIQHFMSLENAKTLSMPRCILPEESDPAWKLRLICVADAAEGAGGTAIYAGIKLPDGSYTCDLLLAKSRLMSHSVPRNELEAILLAAEAALLVRKALGDRVEDVFFFTDSVVAMCWVLNTRKRLRMFVYNRVQSIRAAIRQVADGLETVPLYHIEGTQNVADMVTKPRKITNSDLEPGSPWMNGYPWMRAPTDLLPKYQYESPPDTEDDQVVTSEMFPDVDAHQAQVEARELLLTEEPPTDPSQCQPGIHETPLADEDPTANAVFSSRVKGEGESEWLLRNFDFLHLGWSKALARLKNVCKATYLICHRGHLDGPKPGCPVCDQTLEATCSQLVNDTIARIASRQAELAVGPKHLLKTCVKRDRVWYATQRLGKEGLVETADLDFEPFYDSVTIKKVLPVMLVQSPLFRSLTLHTHFVDLPHAGVEATLARIKLTFFPIGDARRVISKVKKACSKCRIMLKRVVGLELADVHKARTTIAPPFFAVQMDIAMGFKARPTKDSRKSMTAHALVIVCLLTSATSIHVIDGLTTQAVIMALERHSSRYGVPAHIFVDSGTQLEKLRDTSFSLRSIEGWESQGMRFSITVSTPKAHEQQGRVEAKIKTVRKMLQTFSDTCELVNTLIGWETTFCRISDFLDNVPIARGSSKAPTDLGWEIITPNRLKLGRNNFRQLEGTVVLSGAPQTMLDRNRALTEKWYEIFVQRIHLLVPQVQHLHTRDLQVGDVVLFTFLDAGVPRMWVWRLGVVAGQKSRSTFEIRYVSTPGSPPRLINRDLRHISLIHGVDEVPPMSTKFWEN